ncbi:hypothetical protein KDX16_25165 [Burkholderia vietnamiensis]|nr:hypothetical protein [Burkholderia vietnamiensis]MBR7972047.1 hypothetical protein [Burkholderia vietnamiensis]
MFSFTFEPLPCRMYLALRPFRQYSYAQSRVIVVSQTTVMLQIGPWSASFPNASAMKQVYRPGLECFFETIRLCRPFWNSIPRFPLRR